MYVAKLHCYSHSRLNVYGSSVIGRGRCEISPSLPAIRKGRGHGGHTCTNLVVRRSPGHYASEISYRKSP